MIKAAGGALWRPRAQGVDADIYPGVEVAIVHRPRYDDWSLPKGKLHTGEAAVVGAVREVEEETGYTAGVQRWLGRTHYRVGRLTKTVDYWAMRSLGGEFTPNDEVDQVRWLTPPAAAAALTRDHQMLDSFTAHRPDTATVLLVRHARAGDKKQWRGQDRLRPLDRIGQRQTAALGCLLPVFHPVRVLSADRVRCVDTVRPLADALGLSVEIDPMFDEAQGADAGQAATGLRSLTRAGEAIVVCSQGGLIPETLRVLASASGVVLATPAASKGSVWALSFHPAGHLVGADYYPPPTDAARAGAHSEC